jgi:hypothetical protein
MDKKVALCFIISGKHILNKEEIWREWIDANKEMINVYFHYENLSKITSNWIQSKAIPAEKTVITGYYHIVPAYMTLIEHAISHDIQNKWFCFLTDSCAPIVSPAKFKEMFIENSEISIFKWDKAPWNALFNKRANLKYLPKEYRLSHDPWFTLTKIDAEYCLRFVKEKPLLFSQTCAGIIANESVFAIILKFYKRLRFVVNAKGHIVDFVRMSSSTSPYVFQRVTLQDIKYIRTEREKNKYAMFVRKIEPAFSDNMLRTIINNK